MLVSAKVCVSTSRCWMGSLLFSMMNLMDVAPVRVGIFFSHRSACMSGRGVAVLPHLSQVLSRGLLSEQCRRSSARASGSDSVAPLE